MAWSHVISALVKKRAELSGDLVSHDRQRKLITTKIDHIDSALAIFGFDGVPQQIKTKMKAPPRLFKRGRLRRMVADITRERPELRNPRDIALEVFERMGWDMDDAHLFDQVVPKVVHVAADLKLVRADFAAKPLTCSNTPSNFSRPGAVSPAQGRGVPDRHCSSGDDPQAKRRVPRIVGDSAG